MLCSDIDDLVVSAPAVALFFSTYSLNICCWKRSWWWFRWRKPLVFALSCCCCCFDAHLPMNVTKPIQLKARYLLMNCNVAVYTQLYSECLRSVYNGMKNQLMTWSAVLNCNMRSARSCNKRQNKINERLYHRRAVIFIDGRTDWRLFFYVSYQFAGKI